ncbi:MAG: phosphomannomutase/phosphoglucomutase [Anaerolineales bacterium]
MSVWKSCDIRGVFGTELDTAFATRLGRAIGARTMGETVLVAGDVRPSTGLLKPALIAGLVASGARVLDAGIVPTPAFYHAKRRLGAACGVMVTASHNPAVYNGFKIELGALPITEEELAELRAAVERDSWSPAPGGSVEPVDALGPYQHMLIEAFPPLKRQRVVVDAGNGCMSTVAPPLLAELGIDVQPLFSEPDGTFPHRSPNPADARNLVALSEAVRAAGAELGLAFDGDGDRVAVVDGAGQMQPADRVFVLLVQRALRTRPGAPIVYDLKSSAVVPEAIVAAGGRPCPERSGFAYIKRRLWSEGAPLAGEVSGHYFFGELGGDDALYAACALLAELDARGQTLDEALAGVPRYPITPDIRVACPPERARAIIAELAAAYADHPLDRLDGVRIEFGDGWALARESVTEPLITLRFEAHTPERLAAIQREVRAASPLLQETWPG